MENSLCSLLSFVITRASKRMGRYLYEVQKIPRISTLYVRSHNPTEQSLLTIPAAIFLQSIQLINSISLVSFSIYLPIKRNHSFIFNLIR